MPELRVLLAVKDSLDREGLASLIQGDKDLHARIECCEQSKAPEAAYNLRAEVVIFDRDDNVLPGPCTHVLEQVAGVAVLVITHKKDCPFLYYHRRTTCVEELDHSFDAILKVLRCLRK